MVTQLHPKGHSPQVWTHSCCGQTAGWIKMPLGTKVGLGPGHMVLDGAQLAQKNRKPRKGADGHRSQHARPG